jgi:GT2 family glycosyltransferase
MISGPQSVPPPTRENSAAVVVLFNPEGSLAARLLLVQRQVGLLIVVSNDAGGVARLAELDPGRLLAIDNGSNIGLAAALNIGLKRAKVEGFSWCLLLDQDTVVHGDLISGLAATFTAFPRPHEVGLLAPNYRSPEGARLAYPSGRPCQEVLVAVTSGSLVPLGVLDRVGYMRESFFIEGIDVEFSLRLRAAGLRIVASGAALMTHGAGATEARRFFGRCVLVGHHSPWRCFMQFRNVTWILRHYWRGEPLWTRATLRGLFKRIALVCLFERQRAAKLWAMARGIGAGFREEF